jgi:hypothetical protein
MAKRKPTTQEALDKLATLPDFETPPPLKIVPPLFRAPLAIPFILDQGGKAIARVLIRADPLNRIDDSTRAIINDPGIVADNQGNIVQVMSDAEISASPAATKPRKVTAKMKKQRKIQSTAFRNANARGRKKDGTFRAGYDQSRIARMAQKECTKERQRLGLCEKPKRRSTRKGQVRKTARRAFE